MTTKSRFLSLSLGELIDRNIPRIEKVADYLRRGFILLEDVESVRKKVLRQKLP